MNKSKEEKLLILRQAIANSELEGLKPSDSLIQQLIKAIENGDDIKPEKLITKFVDTKL